MLTSCAYHRGARLTEFSKVDTLVDERVLARGGQRELKNSRHPHLDPTAQSRFDFTREFALIVLTETGDRHKLEFGQARALLHEAEAPHPLVHARVQVDGGHGNQ